MGFTEPDSAPAAPGQMPAHPGSGPEPVPYTGDQTAGAITYAAAGVTWNLPGIEVMDSVSGNMVQESGYAHDVDAGFGAPYYGGAVSPIQVHGDADAGGRDDVAATPGAAVANATGRYLEHEGDTHGIGSTIGDLMHFPPAPLDPGAGVGNTIPAGGFYDPPREYGAQEGPPGYQGEAQ